MLLYQNLASNTHRKIYQKSYEINKFKVSVPTWNDKVELPDGSYFVLDTEDYFEFIIKKHETVTDNAPVRVFVNKLENRIIFKIKTGYYLK